MPAGAHLFVYGTLMAAADARAMGRSQRARLQGESISLGPASVPGQLYDLGRYPGLVDDDGAPTRVHGEVVLLRDAPSSLAWLDAYEGIAGAIGADREGDGGAPDEYRRVERLVTLADGRTCSAWLYRFVLDPAGRQPILGGRWTGD